EFARVVRFDGAKIARATNHISTALHGIPSWSFPFSSPDCQRQSLHLAFDRKASKGSGYAEGVALRPAAKR
ncbi:MAG: hypothetical protein WAM84_10130, partial [Candidatus Cybelea sp.]